MTASTVFPDLAGKSILITGGGSGIGAAMTIGFLKQGAKVAFLQRSDATMFCDEAEAETGTRPLHLKCDISDTDQLSEAILTAQNAHGGIDTLVNNAANDHRHLTLDTSSEDWERLIGVNLKAYFFAAKAVIPCMQAAGGGQIINVTSTSYMMGNSGYPVYVTANSGLNGMTRALAREFGPDRIRVNALAPGWVMTDKQKELWVTPEALEEHLKKQCLKETIGPEDIVEPTLFLASNASRMMTGQVLVIDAGVVVTG